MNILCLDLEGVLIPEMWQAVAAATRVDALQKTTRDIPVYDDLMQMRLATLAEHDIRMSTIQAAIADEKPLPGAQEFLQWAEQRFQIAIISDTFYEFAMPLMAQLNFPFLLCHRLEVEDDRIKGYRLRQSEPKVRSVAAFKSLDYTVFAAGDSFNDVGMLRAADKGFFFNAPDNVKREVPEIEPVEGYQALRRRLEEEISG